MIHFQAKYLNLYEKKRTDDLIFDKLGLTRKNTTRYYTGAWRNWQNSGKIRGLVGNN